MRQVGYLQELYRDARSAKRKNLEDKSCVHNLSRKPQWKAISVMVQGKVTKYDH